MEFDLMIETIITYDNVLSPALCDRIIHVVKKGLDVFSFSKDWKHTGILLNEHGDTGQELSQICLSAIHERTIDYLKRYPSLELLPENIFCSNFFVTNSDNILDKYYQFDQDILSRNIVSWYLFLSDNNEDNAGGEIEFTMFNKRINPSKGRLVLFPNGISYIYNML